MNYHLHENGWTAIIDDLDLKTATVEDINEISKLIAAQTCVVIRGQFLSVEEELRVIKLFKDPKPLFSADPEQGKHINVPGTDGLLCRVTGEKNEEGIAGIAGYTRDLAWHANLSWRSDRKPIIWLYGIRGTAGSRTSWNNTVHAYKDMDQTTKDKLKSLTMEMACDCNQCKSGVVEGICESSGIFEPPLVHTNIAGITGLYFPFFQIKKFVGMTHEESQAIIDPLMEYVTQDKYCYHHDWQDGDIVIAEQWLGIHKRWAFEKIEQRLLHRAALDFPEQVYERIL